MSTFQQLREDLHQALDSMSEGWQKLHKKASGALTKFTGGKYSATKNDSKVGTALAFRNAGWAMLAAEVFDDDRSLIVRLETPGLVKEDIDIEVRDSYLIIRGEKKFEQERSEGSYHITERAYGSFERAIPIPDGVDTNKARANYRDGVLKIELPKIKTTARERLTINIT